MNDFEFRRKLIEFLDYNPETGLFTWKVRYGSAVKGQIAGCLAHDKSIVLRFQKILHRAHRLAWLYVHGSWPKGEIDHVNGNPADNRISNLRDCSRRENTRNVRTHRDTASGLKGAYRDKKRWTSRICIDGKNVHLGMFDTAEDAAKAYDEAAKKLHGRFARINGD